MLLNWDTADLFNTYISMLLLSDTVQMMTVDVLNTSWCGPAGISADFKVYTTLLEVLTNWHKLHLRSIGILLFYR